MSIHGIAEGIAFYERIAREGDVYARYEARLVLGRLYERQRELEVEEEAEEIARIEEEEEEYVETEPERLYRFSYGIVFSYHGEYYSIVAQGWSTTSGDAEIEELVKEEAIDRYEDTTKYSMENMLAYGASAEVDQAWEEVTFDERLIGRVGGRTEFRSKRTFQRWVRRSVEKFGW